MCKNIVVAFLISVAIAFSLSACAKLSSRVTPNTNLNQYETYFVVRHARDSRLIDEIIRDEMIQLGLKAQSGTIGQKPPRVDVIVTYEDRWAWDMTTYMLSLTVDFRDAKNNVLLATGQSYRPSLERKSPQEMAREVLESIMKKANISRKAAVIPKEVTSIPKETSVSDISLRKEPVDNLSENDINKMFLKYGFWGPSNQSSAYFNNNLADNNDGTVSDIITGLMWQRSGSSKSLNHTSASKYIKSLNAKSYAGYSDWRMPTVEELASLIEKDKIDGAHIDPVFNNKQVRCWSADGPGTTASSMNFNSAWVVDYKYGKPRRAIWPKRYAGAWMDSYIVLPDNYIRAVRSADK
jgi:hypothetical protein